jgi:hypothetical protein
MGKWDSTRFQIPTPNHQKNFKHQTTRRAKFGVSEIEAWSFSGGWMLVLGI